MQFCGRYTAGNRIQLPSKRITSLNGLGNSNETDGQKVAEVDGGAKSLSSIADFSVGTPPEKTVLRGQRKHELTKFCQLIQCGDYDHVKTVIWNNPRFLVSFGYTPTTIKEEFRYNALHICSISRQARIAELVLQTVANPNFCEMLAGKDASKELSEKLLDYYLNMPDSSCMETPLHMAVKFGNVEVVEVLTSYPECKMRRNYAGLLPKDIICSRSWFSTPTQREKIELLLGERYYVPVLRSVDKTIPPKIGQPFLCNNPPNMNFDPLSPEIEIQALAGPMNEEQAKQFYRRWKTPSRTAGTGNAFAPLTQKLVVSPVISTAESRSPQKNVGPVGPPSKNNFPIISNEKKPLLQNHKVQFKDIMAKICFLNFCNQISDPSIDDNYLKFLSTDGGTFEKIAFTERYIKIADPEKGFEIIGRVLTKKWNIKWSEYWDFLDLFVDIASPHGLLQFENYLTRHSKKTETSKIKAQTIKKLIGESSLNALKNSYFPKRRGLIDGWIGDFHNDRNHIVGKADNIASHDGPARSPPQSATPYTCVKKSMQVSLKGTTDAIVQREYNETPIRTWCIMAEGQSQTNTEFEKDNQKFFINGNNPTKRDVDVLKAILHVALNKEKYPMIHAWKTALLRYSKEELEAFS